MKAILVSNTMKDDPLSLLKQINSPDDLKQLNVDQLPIVCQQLRQCILSELSVNPGHLASSLGTIELTVALHYVFDTPYDKIIWDVGHQAYGHKILTGRRDLFKTNRKLNGLHPFPTPQESPYDAFICGHASNSISAALGIAVAEMQNQEQKDNANKHIIAVIGDGAMSGGLAFEGLNNVSSIKNDLLIVFNDNNMSINRSVGGMSKYLLRLNTNKTYNILRFKIACWLHRKGFLKNEKRKAMIRLNNAIKSALSKQQNIFEGLNIRYFGPYNGHNVVELVKILNQIKDMTGPKMLHLHTTKGKGYRPAEGKADIWHAPGKFNVESGQRLNEEKDICHISFNEVFGYTLLELAKDNPRIVGVTPAMSIGCSMDIMAKEMPDRVFDVGIAEAHAVTFSAGMAKEGLQPFCNIYSSFSQRAYDNIIHDVAILKLPVVLCLDRAGIVGEDGTTHHGVFDMAFLRPIPDLIIASPIDEHELRKLMYTAQTLQKGPFVIRYPRGKGCLVDWKCPFEEIKIGTGRKLKEGEDLAVLTIGPIGLTAIKAIKEVEHLTKRTIAHYDMRFLKPLDCTLLEEIATKYKTIVTIEDGVRSGGFGSAVLEWMADRAYPIHITRLGVPDSFIKHGTIEQLMHIANYDKQSIIETLLNLIR